MGSGNAEDIDKGVIMGNCVDCVCYSPKRDWVMLFPVITHRCANPENMKNTYDHVIGKAKLAYCYACNGNGECKQFVEASR